MSLPTLSPALDRDVVARLADIRLADVDRFGGKNASLGELLAHLTEAGVKVPAGIATSADAFRRHLAASGLDERIARILVDLDVDDTRALAEAGRRIRDLIETTPLAADLDAALRAAFADLEAEQAGPTSWAVRSSATAEDLPDASFAGQQETFLGITGIENVLDAVRKVFASLYNDRAIAYRVHHGFVHAEVAISAGIQRMVRSDLAASGVMFTVDTESGFDGAVFVTSAYGLGEGVVQGAVNPDEFYVGKAGLAAGRPAILKRGVGAKALKMVFTDDDRVGETTAFVEVDHAERTRLSLTDDEVHALARHALAIERHYGRPMDIEWAKDGLTGELFVVQARPETVVSRAGAGIEKHTVAVGRATALLTGRAIGQRAGSGSVAVLTDPSDMHAFRSGDVLVADMTDPDWEPIMKKASAIITNRGGRTCHAAIIARELGVPAVVGTGTATSDLAPGAEVTVSCAEGETGVVYAGLLPIEVTTTAVDSLPAVGTKLMMNVGNPELAFAQSRIPNQGVGLARMEFIINRQIGIHPRALLELTSQPAGVRAEIEQGIAAYASPREFFVQRLVEGIGTIATAFADHPVIIRLSDFKSNEYAHLLGGKAYEPDEENPMIGFRGASRYASESFAEAFALECEALRYLRDEMGLVNIRIMVPFVRRVAEIEAVLEIMASHGLRRGVNGLQIVMMCEIPSNALNADAFLDHVDGFSIGSNDLTQLTLGVDRDSALVASAFDERDPAVLRLVELAITACRARGKYVGICGQGPSDHPDFADWLVSLGIESMSLNPDTVVETWRRLASSAAA
ncbi:phosphoenolpyruvate synthase [Frondihabitans australicus]|uniref:Phosphoenolpyruvate synthase n=2 Tax=Frondihabitans australicus TaxID=386892 RepID=A0A495IIJ5_9MICO|nr:phosphoenolpyruvate synthase [Frondihabitans australicus]